MLFNCCFKPKTDDEILDIKKNNIFNKQLNKENKKVFKHIKDIGSFNPNEVYYGNDTNLKNNILHGLCSLCENPIHISVGFNPSRLILSHCSKKDNEIIKEDCFYIMNLIEQEKIDNVNKITQYHIYSAIQSYIYEKNEYPKHIIKDEAIVISAL